METSRAATQFWERTYVIEAFSNLSQQVGPTVWSSAIQAHEIRKFRPAFGLNVEIAANIFVQGIWEDHSVFGAYSGTGKYHYFATLETLVEILGQIKRKFVMTNLTPTPFDMWIMATLFPRHGPILNKDSRPS